ncbi:MAG: hypothetical protein HY081_07325 [Gammaproteobacteria bacterium]|nr:hypothetical protein [Gammaproteobacteria bacterium]
MTFNLSRRYAPWLWLLIGLFVFRVIAQPLALLTNTKFLPPFESWHSGVLPYPALFVIQILILAWLTYTARRFTTGTIFPHRRSGTLMLILGVTYFATMLVRFALGATLLAEQRWFASPLPTFFHLVLASFLLLYGHFHFRHGPKES